MQYPRYSPLPTHWDHRCKFNYSTFCAYPFGHSVIFKMCV